MIIKYLKLVFVLIIIVGLSSCHKKESIVENNFVRQWDRLIIDTENQRIVIDNEVDYGVDYGWRCFWDIKEIYSENGQREYQKVNYKEEEFNITKEERDSLFVCIYDIVTNPVYPKEYEEKRSGKIFVSFTDGPTTLSCSYNSIRNWTTISPQLNKLYLMLKNKTEISEE